MKFLLAALACLAGCCQYEEPGNLVIVGEAVTGPTEPAVVLLFDEKWHRLVWVKKGTYFLDQYRIRDERIKEELLFRTSR